MFLQLRYCVRLYLYLICINDRILEQINTSSYLGCKVNEEEKDLNVKTANFH